MNTFDAQLRLTTRTATPRKASDTQLWRMQLVYGTGANDRGDLIEQRMTAGSATEITQIYGYDGFNRLISVRDSAPVFDTPPATQKFAYDRWGNRAFRAGSYLAPGFPSVGGNAVVVPLTATVDDVAAKFPNNKILNQGADHDEAGRMKQIEGRPVEYDFDGRITKIKLTGANPEEAEWHYDGEGRRVREQRWTGTGTTRTLQWETVFVYGPQGTMVAEYDTRGPQGTAGTKYLTVDHLGSTRMVTKGSGNTEAEVVDSRHDYLPFGEEVRSSGGPKEKFTGKKRAEVSGTRVDYFGARYLSAGLGRFLSPDKPLVDQHTSDPQSWNLYVYVRNSPLEFHDPDGQVCIFGIGDTCSQLPPVLNPPPPPPPPVLKPNGQLALTPSGQPVQGPVQVGPSVGGLSAAPTPGLGIGLTAGATGVAGLGVVGTAATANVAGVLFR